MAAMEDPGVIAQGVLTPITWPELEAFARNLSDFCKVHVTPDHVISTRFEPGEIEIRWQGRRANILLRARIDAGLQNLRDTLAHMLETVGEGLSAGLVWQDDTVQAGRLPLNFRHARVAAVDRITPRFVRLRLEAEDIAYLGQTGLHLRLLQPRDPANPRWPRLLANGRTDWPGTDHLHMPVYTIRALDVAAGWLDVDVFVHGRGATCAWASAARPGTGIGVTGPGGGWFPQGRRLCLGGDETALPVMARILEEAPRDATGTALIEVEDSAEIQPIRAPDGVAVRWLLRRAKGPGLRAAFTDAATAALSDDMATEVQFAGEKADALAIKAGLRDTFGKLPATVTAAGYWTRPA